MTSPAAAAPPDLIYVIRHGEKPADPPPGAAGQTAAAPGPPFGIDSPRAANRSWPPAW
jgi:hypothetical protein